MNRRSPRYRAATGEGVYEELRYGVTVRKSRDGKRTSLFARALAGGDVGTFNLHLADSSRTSPEVREVPIVLQKSFCTVDRKFFEL